MVKKTSNKYSDKKIIWFTDKMDSFKNNEVKPPIYVRFKPINICNHRCFFCVYNTDYSNMHGNMSKKDRLTKEKCFEILDDFKDMNVKAITYSGGGEPLLHPDIIEIINKTKQNGIDLSIITNAQLLSGEKAEILYDAKWVRISMDYFNADLFHETRAVSKDKFQMIVNNIVNFNKNKNDNCDLSINYIITKINYKFINDAVKFFKDLKVDNIRISPVWTKDFMNYHNNIKELVIKDINIARNKFESDIFKIYDSYVITEEVTQRKYKKCFIQQTIPVIGADYKVYTCHNKAYDDDGIIGDISEQSFKEMWNSEQTKEFFDKFDASHSCNHQCANDNKNIFINEMVDCFGDNFV